MYISLVSFPMSVRDQNEHPTSHFPSAEDAGECVTI